MDDYAVQVCVLGRFILLLKAVVIDASVFVCTSSHKLIKGYHHQVQVIQYNLILWLLPAEHKYIPDMWVCLHWWKNNASGLICNAKVCPAATKLFTLL